jgi:hypothetical protein
MFSTQLVRSFALAAVMTIGLAMFAAPASAQLQPWEDYEASDSVWIVTHVDLDPGTFGIYLEGLKSTWIAANEVAKELGQIKDYAIYANQYGGADEFDLLLVIEMESTDDIAPNRQRYEEFLVRRIQGNYLLRKIDVK